MRDKHQRFSGTSNMALRCPVSGKTAADATLAPSGAVAQCPFASAAAQADPASRDSEADASQPSAKTTCPYGFGSRANDEATSEKDGAVCPMGFGSATPKDPLAALQCTRCEALFYDAVKIACGHFFCRSCIANVGDCILCGADVQDMQPEARLQELVNLYLEVNGDAGTFEAKAALLKGTVTQAHPQAHNGSRAEFLEQQALRSLAGGNVAAASQRMGLCRDALLEDASSAGYTPQLCYRLGSVIGVQATLLEQQGQAEAAAEAYRESIEQLKKSPEHTPEVVQAMAVSLNKLGDRQYLGKDLRGAMQYYEEALRVRQDSCKGAEAVPAEALLGLVTSLLKVVDIEQALDDQAAAQEHMQEARSILCRAEEVVPQQGPLWAKYSGLQAFVQQVE